MREVKVASEPEALVALFGSRGLACERIGLEAGPLSQWLHAGLERAGLPVVLIETRHVEHVLGPAQPDPRGGAVGDDDEDRQARRTRDRAADDRRGRPTGLGAPLAPSIGWFKPGHVKTLLAQAVRAPLTARKLLIEKLRDVDNSVRGILRGFGLKVGRVGKAGFAARIRELVVGQAMLEAVVEPMLQIHEALRKQHAILHRQLLRLIGDDEVCQRLMTVPGVGPVVAMTYKFCEEPGWSPCCEPLLLS